MRRLDNNVWMTMRSNDQAMIHKFRDERLRTPSGARCEGFPNGAGRLGVGAQKGIKQASESRFIWALSFIYLNLRVRGARRVNGKIA